MQERMRAVRNTKKLSQREFGEVVGGISRDTINNYENGRAPVPEIVVRAICREFNISYEWLTDGVEPMYIPQESSDMASLERIMTGNNEYVKSIFRELADMPEEWWEQAVDMLKRVDAAKKDRQ